MDSNERKLAHSDRLVLPRITAPPARSFAATVESCKADMPTSANNPAVVCILSTVASTGSRRQQPCCGDHGHHPLCTREAYKRECLSPLYEEATSAFYADSGNTGSSECQLLDFQQRRRRLEPGILAHWIEPRPEPVRVRVPCRAFLSCLFIAVGG